MKTLFDKIKKPRNIYFSIIVMLTIVTGLVSITFSYYVDESSNKTKLVSLKEVNNIIQSDYLTDGKITIPANQTIEIPIYIISNNNFESEYKLYYKTTNQNIEVYYLEDINNIIDGKDVQKLTLSLENYENMDVEVYIGIANGYVNSNIIIEDKEILKK